MLFIYVLLFEFILPPNKFLPKPSLVFDSYYDLAGNYSLFSELTITTLVIYGSLILGYLFISVASPVLIRLFIRYPGLFNGMRVFRNFPAFFYAVLFAYWFSGSIAAEFLFAFVAAVFLIGLSVNEKYKYASQEYILTAVNLGASESKIYKDVIWKEIQPKVFQSLKRIHFYLWIQVLLFEFISKNIGLGSIYYIALAFDDLAALFALALLISILILAGMIIINIFYLKLFPWYILNE